MWISTVRMIGAECVYAECENALSTIEIMLTLSAHDWLTLPASPYVWVAPVWSVAYSR